MPLIINLPRQLRIESMYQLISDAIDEHQNPRDAAITFNFSQLSFADPDGITIFSNLLEWLRKRDVSTALVAMDAERAVVQYMDDCGFFRLYNGKPLRLFAATRDTTMPFRRILVEESHAWLDLIAFPWLAEKLHLTLASLAELKTSVRELFNNIGDHSEENIGCIHMQLYPSNNSMRIAVSDFGVGIPTEIRRTYGVPHDAAAIALAVQEGVSSKPEGRNRGAGLSYLIDNVVGRNGGWVGIYSNHGELTCVSAKDGMKRNQRVRVGFYPGTLVSIDLRTNRIEQVLEERETLEW